MGRPFGSKNKTMTKNLTPIITPQNYGPAPERKTVSAAAPVTVNELDTYLRGFNDARKIFERKENNLTSSEAKTNTLSNWSAERQG